MLLRRKWWKKSPSGIFLPGLSDCSSQRGPSLMACTGKYGTTTKACQRTRASSTTRTSSSGYHGCDRSKSAMSPVPSTKTSRAKFSNATTSTPHTMRTLPPLAPRMELRKSPCSICCVFYLFKMADWSRWLLPAVSQVGVRHRDWGKREQLLGSGVYVRRWGLLPRSVSNKRGINGTAAVSQRAPVVGQRNQSRVSGFLRLQWKHQPILYCQVRSKKRKFCSNPVKRMKI